MKNKTTRKKIGKPLLIRLTAIFVTLLCLVLIGGTARFFTDTLDALAVAQKGGTSAPPKIAAVNSAELDAVLEAAAARQSDGNKLKNDFPNPFAAVPVPTAPATPPTSKK
jgi:hypothetical protein